MAIEKPLTTLEIAQLARRIIELKASYVQNSLKTLLQYKWLVGKEVSVSRVIQDSSLRELGERTGIEFHELGRCVQFYKKYPEADYQLQPWRKQILALPEKPEETQQYEGRQEIQVLEGDFEEQTASLTDGSVDLILTDPPYGAQYLPVWEKLAKLASRLLKTSAFLVTYSGQLYLPKVFDSLSSYGLEYYWTFALEHESAGIPNGRDVKNKWKPILIYYKPPLGHTEIIYDFVRGAGRDKSLHDWQQATVESQYFIRYFTKPGDLVLDPMAGSGTTLLAAYLQNRRAIGIDSDPEAIQTIKGRLSEL